MPEEDLTDPVGHKADGESTGKGGEPARLESVGIESPQPVPPPVLKAATWQEKDEEGPWCPDPIHPYLGFEFRYERNPHEAKSASPGWHIVAATRRGRMHAHQGTHREDAYHFHIDDDFTIVCVSDGAGSYQYSRIGSESTCRKVVAEVARTLESLCGKLKASPEIVEEQMKRTIEEAVAGACGFLHHLARESGSKPKDFRCTLVLGVLWQGSGSPKLFFSQVGDGFMASLAKDGKAQRHGKSDSGDFSGEVNCFVPDEGAVENAKVIEVIDASNEDAFIFCSDGIEDPFYPTEKKSEVIFQQLRDGVADGAKLEGFTAQKPHGPVIGSTEAGERLATWLSFEKKGENDDRTMVVLHRSAAMLDRSPKVSATIMAPVHPAPGAAEGIAAAVGGQIPGGEP